MEEDKELSKLQEKCRELQEQSEMIRKSGTEADAIIANKIINKPDMMFEYFEEHPEQIEEFGIDRYQVLDWLRNSGFSDKDIEKKDEKSLFQFFIGKYREMVVGKKNKAIQPVYLTVSEEPNEKVVQSMQLTKVRYGFTLCEKNIFLKVVDICQRYLKNKELGDNCTMDVKVLLGSGFVPMITFPIKDVMPNTNVNYTWIKETLQGMIDKKFGIPNEDWDFKENVLFQSVMSDAGRGKVGVILSTAFWEAFLKLDCYKIIDVNVARSFKSVAAERFYELLVNNKREIYYEVENIKKMFCMEDKYKNNGHFIKGVINSAQTEMKKLDTCPIYFDYELIRGERNKIEKIKFVVVNKTEQKKIDEAHQKLLDQTNGVKLSERVISAIKECYPKIDVKRFDVEPKLKWCQLNLGVDGFEAEIRRIHKIAFDLLMTNKLETTISGYFLKTIEKVVDAKVREEQEKHIDKVIKPIIVDNNEYPFKRINIGKDDELNAFGEDEEYNYYTMKFIRHYAGVMDIKSADELQEKGFEKFNDLYWRAKKTR